jgi:hypothetical protein
VIVKAEDGVTITVAVACKLLRLALLAVTVTLVSLVTEGAVN